MKLSAAIRKGAMKVPRQIRGVLYMLDSCGNIIGCCALGAAALGSGIKFKSTYYCYDYDILEDAFPILSTQLVQRGEGTIPLLEAIWKLNDAHHWTFDQIATWLESHGA